MKNLKKVLAIVIATAMVMAMGLTAFAQTVGTAAEGKGSITISNPSKGIEYKVYKIFDATVSGTDKINYTKSGFTELRNGDTVLFEADTAGNITATDAAKNDKGELTNDAITALAGIKGSAVTTATSDGSTPLTFAGLDYGYYYVESGLGAAVSVDSTMPNVTIKDKNTKTPQWDDGTNTNGKLVSTDGTNYVDSTSVKAGDTVYFKLDITASNYCEDQQVANYIISDDLPAGLTFGSIQSVTVAGTALTSADYTLNTSTTSTDGKFSVTIPWVTVSGTGSDTTYTSKYPANAKILVVYTATLDGDNAVIAKTGNVNEADFTWNYVPTTPGGDNPEPKIDIDTEKATVYTYAFAIQKVDEDGKGLAGAVFQLPFYVKSTADADGAYIYAGTTAATGLTNELTSPADGLIIVKGLEENHSVTVTEKTAPNGYNKVAGSITVDVTKTTETTTSTSITKYIDANGNVYDTEPTTSIDTKTVTISNSDIVIGSAAVVMNKAGQELPETGGIGTTIFYVIGSVLVLGAGIVMITRRRMSF